MHVNEPAQCIRAVTTSLRTAQHFNALYIEQCRDRADAAEIDIIHEKTDRRVWRSLVLLQFANAPYLEVARAVAVARPVQVWNESDEFFKMLRGKLIDLLTVEN